MRRARRPEAAAAWRRRAVPLRALRAAAALGPRPSPVPLSPTGQARRPPRLPRSAVSAVRAAPPGPEPPPLAAVALRAPGRRAGAARRAGGPRAQAPVPAQSQPAAEGPQQAPVRLPERGAGARSGVSAPS